MVSSAINSVLMPRPDCGFLANFAASNFDCRGLYRIKGVEIRGWMVSVLVSHIAGKVKLSLNTTYPCHALYLTVATLSNNNCMEY